MRFLGLRKENAKIVILCLLWYSTSSINNVIGKRLLMRFEYPMTLTLIQLLSISILSEPLLRILRRIKSDTNHNFENVSRNYFLTIIVPLGLGKFIASVFSHISIWKVPVSYAHTVKGTMPLFTVLLTYLIYREIPSGPVLLSLVPIIVGVGIATATELSFDVNGLSAALIATCFFSLQNIFSKKVLKDTHISAFGLLALLGRTSLILFFPIWLYFDGMGLLFGVMQEDENALGTKIELLNHPPKDSIDYLSVGILLFLDGFLNFCQNIMAFAILSLVTPLTYAVANATKRISIIAISLILLKNPVTFSNLFGIGLAIFGIFGYNRAKIYDRNKKTQLPLYKKATSDVNSNRIIV